MLIVQSFHSTEFTTLKRPTPAFFTSYCSLALSFLVNFLLMYQVCRYILVLTIYVKRNSTWWATHTHMHCTTRLNHLFKICGLPIYILGQISSTFAFNLLSQIRMELSNSLFYPLWIFLYKGFNTLTPSLPGFFTIPSHFHCLQISLS